MKLLQLLITAFMLGATIVLCWLYSQLIFANTECHYYEHNNHVLWAEFGFYILIALLGIGLLVGLIVGIAKRTWWK